MTKRATKRSRHVDDRRLRYFEVANEMEIASLQKNILFYFSATMPGSAAGTTPSTEAKRNAVGLFFKIHLIIRQLSNSEGMDHPALDTTTIATK
ncbi:MAG: hypothetical protein Q7U84_07705 [Polynucleobacter sp.]|nr:hypothetical protein [Polynucleobacter sp.]